MQMCVNYPIIPCLCASCYYYRHTQEHVCAGRSTGWSLATFHWYWRCRRTRTRSWTAVPKTAERRREKGMALFCQARNNSKQELFPGPCQPIKWQSGPLTGPRNDRAKVQSHKNKNRVATRIWVDLLSLNLYGFSQKSQREGFLITFSFCFLISATQVKTQFKSLLLLSHSAKSRC